MDESWFKEDVLLWIGTIERELMLIKCNTTAKFMVGFSPKFGFQVTQWIKSKMTSFSPISGKNKFYSKRIPRNGSVVILSSMEKFQWFFDPFESNASRSTEYFEFKRNAISRLEFKLASSNYWVTSSTSQFCALSFNAIIPILW